MEFLGEYLLRNAVEFPDRTAVVQDERSMTYRELNIQCSRLSLSLEALGIKRGDRIAVLMKSSIEWLLVLYACQKIGVGLTLVHARLLPEEILRTMDVADAGTLIYSLEYADKAAYIEANSSRRRNYISLGSGADSPAQENHYAFEHLMRSQDAAEAQISLRGEEDSIILFTSGTTSAAKGIVRTQEMMSVYASLFQNEASRARPDILLTPSPLYHAAGLCCVIKMLVNAGTLVLLSSFDCQKICRQIQELQATQIALVPPTSYQRLKASGYPALYDLSSVRLAHIAAGKASRDCLRDLFEMFPNAKIRLSWGSTEASNITCSVLDRAELQAKPRLLGTVGKINAVADLRLVSDDGSIVEGEGHGEAYVRSPLVFSGYIKDPQLTARSFSAGWFKTEDILQRDAEGYYYLLDRKRDIIKTGGENVYAQEVEQAILENPVIAECAVVGVPDPKFGEAVAAAIVVKEGQSITEEEFVRFCRSVLPSFKKPKYWAVMNALPKNDIGKVCKPVIKSSADRLFTKIA
ncbi:MAG: class I adenylate-forming enzyme family protein [Candidatus Onthomonas sp.]